MASKVYQFTVGRRTFTMHTLQPFSAAKYAMQIKALVEKGMANGKDSNVITVLSQLDEKTLTTLIFPILSETLLTCTSEEQKLQSPADMDEIYSVDDMDEFFLVVWEVLKTNFAPFFKKLIKSLCGFDLDSLDVDKIRATLREMALAQLDKQAETSEKKEA